MTWDDAVCVWLARAALCGLVVSAAGCVAVRLTRQPARRARLAALALAASLLAPALSLVPGWPAWRVGWPAAAPVAPDKPAIEVERASPDIVPLTPAVEAEPKAENAPVVAAPAAQVVKLPEWSQVLAGAYLLGVTLFAAWWLLGWVRLRSLLRDARPVNAAVRARFDELAGRGGRRVRLLAHAGVVGPLACGVIRPAVVLPADLCADADAPELRSALAHEWAHVERGDLWAWQLANLTRALLWFLPTVWLLRTQLRRAQDHAADAYAAARAGSPDEYAQHLVALAGRALSGPSAVLGMAARPSELSGRVKMVLDQSRRVELKCPTHWAILALAGVAALTVALAGVRLAAADPPPTPPKPTPDAKPPALAPGNGTVTGTIVDDDGMPLAGADVTVTAEAIDERAEVRTLATLFAGKTDAAGRYSFPAPGAAAAGVRVSAAAPNRLSREAEHAADPAEVRRNLPAELPPLALPPGKVVTGTVLRPDGTRAAGVRVRWLTQRRLPGPGRVERDGSAGETDAAGQFRVSVFAPGDSAVWVTPENFAPLRLSLTDTPADDLGAVSLLDGVRVRGQVQDEEGQPLGGVRLKLGRTVFEEADGLVTEDPTAREATAGPGGVFEFGPLPPGRYSLSQADPAQGEALFLPRTVFVKSRPGGLVILRAVPHVTIRGRTVTPAGKPRPGVPVTVFGDFAGTPWRHTAKPDAAGNFSLLAPDGLDHTFAYAHTDPKLSKHWRASRRDQFTPTKPQSMNELSLGKLSDDVPSMELMVYQAPVLVVSGRNADGQTVSLSAAFADYTSGVVRRRLPPHPQAEVGNPRPYRVTDLVPDQEFVLRVHARVGPEWPPVTLKLAEGETREVTLTEPVRGK